MPRIPRRPLASALLLLCCLAAVGAAPAQDLTTVTYAGKRYTVCRVDLTRRSLELFWRDGTGKPFRRFETLERYLRARKRTLLFAMNAGMYGTDFAPVGLYVAHGKQLRPLNLRRGRGNFCLLPNGVFAVTSSGARVIESSRYPSIRSKTRLATQSGPMLVIDGRLHPAFRAGSTSRLFRNGVGVVSAQQVVFAIAEDPVNFHEFATFFRSHLKCRNALYLDGSISCLYSATPRRNSQLSDVGPMIAIATPR